MGLGCRHIGVAARQPMRQSLRNQRLLRRELGIERSVGQAALLIFATPTPSIPRSRNMRAAVLISAARFSADFSLVTFTDYLPVAAGLTLKIASAI